MKKRLFFLIILTALCVTLLGVSAYADDDLPRLEHSWNGTSLAVRTELNKPYETWYFLDDENIYVSTGDRYTYTRSSENNAIVITLDKGSFIDNKIYMDSSLAYARVHGQSGINVAFYGFNVRNGGSFIASVTGSQEGNQLVFQCASEGGEGSVSYRYHVYDSTGKLIQYGTTYGSSFRVSVSEDDTYEAFVTAVDSQGNVSDCAHVSVEFSNYVVDSNGVITAYIGADDEITIPEQVKGVAVTGIGESAFYNKSLLTKVTVPEGVKTIGAKAFDNCYALEIINLPDGITSISANAFSGCSAKVFCPKNSRTAQKLSPHTFFDTNDTDTVFELLYVKSKAEEEEPSVLTLYKYHGNKKVIDSFPERVTRIYNNAFKDNEVIESVTIPANVTDIGSGAFSGCTNLAEINADDPQLKTIGTNAFKDCLSLTKLELSDNIQTIGADAFSGCPEGLKIYCGAASDTAKAISRTPYDFYTQVLGNEFRMRWDGSGNVLTLLECTGLTTIVTVPAVHVIAAGAFDTMKNNLTEVTIPGTVSVIPGGLFDSFMALGKITLSGEHDTDKTILGVQKLEERAIMNCPDLISVTIPDSVTEIGSYNFVNCPRLTKLVLSDNITTIGPNSFGNPVKVFCDYNSKTAKNMSAAGLAFYDKNDNDAKFRLIYLEDGKTLALYQYTGTGATIAVDDIVQYIYPNAFRGNTTVKSIILPDAVTSIGADAFYGCTALTKIMLLSANVSNISDNAFRNCNAAVFCAYNSITAKKLSAIGHPFYNASEFIANPPRFALLYREDGRTLALHEYTGTETGAAAGIDVPLYVQAIDDGAFDAVKATLTKVGISAVEIIPTGLFDGFTSLTEINFGTGVRTVQPGAIQNCPALESVRGLQRDNAFNTVRSNFENCPKLVRELASSSMRLALDIPYAQKAKIEKLPYAGSLNPNVAACENGVVTAQKTGKTTVLAYFGVEGNYARIPVEVVSGLKGLTLPSALTTIEAEAFAGDSAAQYVALPDVTDIGNRAFADDTNLMLVNIPSTVTSFGENIFSGSDSVVAVIDNNDTAVSYCQDNNIPFQFAANSN